MKEIWKLCHLNNRYEISNLGRVKNKYKKIIKPHISNKGYISLGIQVNGIKKMCGVHRLVMFAFKSDQYFEGAVVNHIDGNKQNNSLDNLEWCTIKQNSEHASKNNLLNPLKGSDNKLSKLTDDQVLEIRKLYNESDITQAQLAKDFEIKYNTICLIVNNKSWSHLSWEPKPIKEKLIREKRIYTTGEKCKSSKLTEEQVLEIRRLYPEVKNYLKLGTQFGVSDNAIKKIVLRKTWNHI